MFKQIAATFRLTALSFGQYSRPAKHTLTDWPEFHRADMTRYNPYEKFLTVNNVKDLGLKWSYTTAGIVYSSPAVANGVVYVGSELCDRKLCDLLTYRCEWYGLCQIQ